MRILFYWLGVASLAATIASAQTITRESLHLRIDGPREWSDFPARPDAAAGEWKFSAKEKNQTPWTLQLRQEDVKQVWSVTLNKKQLGRLVRDENAITTYFPIPPQTLLPGENILRIEPAGAKPTPDDIRAGAITISPLPVSELLQQATLEIEVVERHSQKPLPTRLTILAKDGSLQTVGAESNDHLAIRPGTIYSSTGKAKFGVPAGEYRIFAGRGFEYSLDSADVVVKAGQTVRQKLQLVREVSTVGYAACDTHVHTLTHSGHGDCTVQERMITLAGEGIELPVASDHNVQIDHEPFAQKMNVRRYFTPVIGNEVTTSTGHFNIFPARQGSAIPGFKQDSWETTLGNIFRTPGVKVAILNHARDTHRGVRPFGPLYFNDVVGENLDGWAMRFNAMEVLNSSATQTDVMRLFHDWMALLNRGRRVTPVGSSDSHDVARHFVGQGRTYIRCHDADPGNIDIDQAAAAFVNGQVLVSYGLLTELTINKKYRSGELVPAFDEEIEIDVEVRGPHWTQADRLELYLNGRLLREVSLPKTPTQDWPLGVKHRQSWKIPRPSHDIHLVAIATGPGVEGFHWRAARPYQPDSPAWRPRMLGASGAVWVDADGDGRATAAHDYAVRLWKDCDGDLPKLVESLREYDRAVAAQAAHLYQQAGGSLLKPDAAKVWRTASEETKAGFARYLEAWRGCQMARANGS